MEVSLNVFFSKKEKVFVCVCVCVLLKGTQTLLFLTYLRLMPPEVLHPKLNEMHQH